MTDDQYEKATPIIKRLNCVRSALEQINKISTRVHDGKLKWADSFDHDPPRDNMTQYYVNLTQHGDGSGFKVEMDGAYVAEEVVEAVKEVLLRNEKKYLKMLEEIG